MPTRGICATYCKDSDPVRDLLSFMSMRRAIIHIGTPRTGTTSFQAILSAHRDKLRQAGLLYPDLTPRSTPGPHLSHQYLGETFDGRRPRRERIELLSTLDQALVDTVPDIVILSYEGLCLLPAWHRAPAMLAELFARRGFAIEILLTVKPQAWYAQSQYTWRCQFLRERRLFAAALPRDLRHRRYDYNAMLHGWASGGACRVHVVPVHDRRSDAPLLARIFAELGLTDRIASIIAEDDLTLGENRSLGPAAIEVARRLRDRGLMAWDSARARAITDFVAAQARARGLDLAPFNALDDDTVQRVSSLFALRNDVFAHHVWGESWSRRVATVPLAEINEIGSQTTDRDRARHIEEIATAAREQFQLKFGPGVYAFIRGFVDRYGII